MRIHTLRRQQFIQRPLTEVFAFFERPENLARITPPSLGFRIVTPSPIPMQKGTTIEYTIKVMGMRISWRSLISEYEPPYRFVDEQLTGPYAFWYHTHAFVEVDGGTTVTDDVQYALPFGILGSIVHRLAVRHQLENIFSYRADVIHKLFGGSEFLGDQMSEGHTLIPGAIAGERYADAT
jgi:ligand-binding SRPBCC domain-containing protein